MKKVTILFLLLSLFKADHAFSQSKEECLKLLTPFHVHLNSKSELVDWITTHLYNKSDFSSTTNKGGSIDLVVPNQNDLIGISSPITFGAKGNDDQVKKFISEQVSDNAYFKSLNTTSEVDFYNLPEIAYNTFKATCGGESLVSLKYESNLSSHMVILQLSLPSTVSLKATIEQVNVTEQGGQTLTWDKSHRSNNITFSPSRQEIGLGSPISIKIPIADSTKSLDVFILAPPYGVLKYDKPNYKELNTPCSNDITYAQLLDGQPKSSLKEAFQRMNEYSGSPVGVISMFIYRLAKGEYYLLTGVGRTYQELDKDIRALGRRYSSSKCCGNMTDQKIINITCKIPGSMLRRVAGKVDGKDVEFMQMGNEEDLPDNYHDNCKKCF